LKKYWSIPERQVETSVVLADQSWFDRCMKENRHMKKATLQKLDAVPLTQVQVNDSFWTPRQETNRKVTIPLEYEVNRKGKVMGAHQWDWWDPNRGKAPWRIIVGDLGKWIEAAAYSLAVRPDPRLAAKVEKVIAGIIKGQKKDGYLYPNPMRRDMVFANLQEYHEMYEVGHDIEGAVAYYAATGRRPFLDAVCRAADLLDRTFGTEKGKLRGYDGHPEIELALVKLYRTTGERRYLKLAKYLVDERGRQPSYFAQEAKKLMRRKVPFFGWQKGQRYENFQAHKPLRQQKEAVGHAVRALYLYSGMADVAAETGDRGLLAVCKRLWQSVTQRRMYVTGGVGSSAHGEAFTFDFDLPNESAYAETCANIALVFFAHRMLQIEADGEYADVMEQALYNGVLSGIALDGRHFFYANHLSAYPQTTETGDNVAVQRQGWFGCACCPPNVARLLASLGGYIYSKGKNEVRVHLYIAGRADLEVGDQRVVLEQKTRYPWDGSVKLTVQPATPAVFAMALRIPGWCRGATIKVNGRSVPVKTTKGYARISRCWRKGDRVELTLPMPVERIEANPKVRQDAGCVALQRGPVVYCLEEVDNGKGLNDLVLPRAARFTSKFDPRLLGGVAVITGTARRRDPSSWTDELYRPAGSRFKTVSIKAVPYAVWANRKPGEMIVWMRVEG